MHRFSILLMVLFLQFGMLTLRCDHIEECNKTLIFHLSIEDLSLSPGSPILKSHSQMSQMKSKSTTQRTPQNVMCILGIQLHLMRKCKLSFFATLTVWRYFHIISLRGRSWNFHCDRCGRWGYQPFTTVDLACSAWSASASS